MLCSNFALCFVSDFCQEQFHNHSFDRKKRKFDENDGQHADSGNCCLDADFFGLSGSFMRSLRVFFAFLGF